MKEEHINAIVELLPLVQRWMNPPVRQVQHAVVAYEMPEPGDTCVQQNFFPPPGSGWELLALDYTATGGLSILGHWTREQSESESCTTIPPETGKAAWDIDFPEDSRLNDTELPPPPANASL
jgi:hypothetical protein